jgi:hypothetical protein
MHQFGQKLIDAGSELIAANTALPLYKSRELFERCTYRAIAKANLTPDQLADLSLEQRFQVVLRTIEEVNYDLGFEGVSDDVRTSIAQQLQDFYVSVRLKPAQLDTAISK